MYLSVVEDDGTDEPPSAAGHLAPVHQVLQLGDLHCALKPKNTGRAPNVTVICRVARALKQAPSSGPAEPVGQVLEISRLYYCASYKKK